MTVYKTYDIGEPARCWFKTKNDAGAYADPSTVTVKVKAYDIYNVPIGETEAFIYGTDAELVKDSTGKFYILVTPTEAGTIHLEWTATGDPAIVEQDVFRVRKANV